MAAKMKERGIEFPRLTGQDMADVLAYLYVSRYFESPGSAEVVRAKGCLAADLARSSVVRSPAALVAGMWNHSRLMERQAEKRDVPWPVLNGQDLADLSAYLGSLSAPPARKAPAQGKSSLSHAGVQRAPACAASHEQRESAPFD